MTNKQLVVLILWQAAFLAVAATLFHSYIDRVEAIDNRVAHIEEILGMVDVDPN